MNQQGNDRRDGNDEIRWANFGLPLGLIAGGMAGLIIAGLVFDVEAIPVGVVFGAGFGLVFGLAFGTVSRIMARRLRDDD